MIYKFNVGNGNEIAGVQIYFCIIDKRNILSMYAPTLYLSSTVDLALKPNSIPKFQRCCIKAMLRK